MFFRKKALSPDAASLPTSGQLFDEAEETLRKAGIPGSTLALAWIEGQKTGRSTWDCLPDLSGVITSGIPLRDLPDDLNAQVDGVVPEKATGRFADLLDACETALQHENISDLDDASLDYFKAFAAWRKAVSAHGPQVASDDDDERDFLQNENLLDRVLPFLLEHDRLETAETIVRTYHEAGLYYNTAQMVAAFADAAFWDTAAALTREIPLDAENGEFHVEALLEIAGACFRQGRSEMARELINEVSALDATVRPDYRDGYPVCLVWVMETLCKSGLPEEAETLYRERRDEIPETDVLPMLIDAYRRQGRWETAWNLLDRIADPIGRFHLALPLVEAVRQRDGRAASEPLYRELWEFLRENLKNDPKTYAYALCTLAVSLRDGTTLPETPSS